MRVRPLLVLTAAVLAVLPSTAGAAEPVVVDDLVYVHHDGQQFDLWTVDVAGGNARSLPSSDDPDARTTNHAGLEHMPVLSPDGAMLAFEARYAEDGADAGVYVQDLGTGAVRRVAGAAGLFEGPTDWYTDAAGQHLVFVREKADGTKRYDAYEVLVTDPALPVRRLTNLNGSVMSVRHDGARLVYQFGAQHAVGAQQVCTATMPTAATPTTKHSCLTKGYVDTDPTVAPNGDVVFVRHSGSSWSLMRLRGGRATVVPTPSTLKRLDSPAFSSDGTLVALSASATLDESGLDIWVLPASGGPARQLTTSQGTDYLPTWARQ